MGRMPSTPRQRTALYDLIASVDSPKEARQLLEDLLTPQELDHFTERWQLVQMLASGMPQREIAKRLGVSIATVTRGSRMLQHGSGGFAAFLKKRLKKRA